jgi:hypothetical protein
MKVRRLFVAATLAAASAAVVTAATSTAATIDAVTTDNLVQNGNAEANPGSNGAKTSVAPWVRNWAGEAVPGCDGAGTGSTTVKYGSSGFPNYGDPGPDDRGSNFFAGGPDCSSHTSYIYQCIDISDHTPTASHPVTWNADAFLGGKKFQKDDATLGVFFTDNPSCTIGKNGKHATGLNYIGPVSANDRAGITGLLERTGSGDVPHGSYGMLVGVRFRRFSGPYNDGYADNISVTLTIHTVTG